jgi:hypothetical protein
MTNDARVYVDHRYAKGGERGVLVRVFRYHSTCVYALDSIMPYTDDADTYEFIDVDGVTFVVRQEDVCDVDGLSIDIDTAHGPECLSMQNLFMLFRA